MDQTLPQLVQRIRDCIQEQNYEEAAQQFSVAEALVQKTFDAYGAHYDLDAPDRELPSQEEKETFIAFISELKAFIDIVRERTEEKKDALAEYVQQFPSFLACMMSITRLGAVMINASSTAYAQYMGRAASLMQQILAAETPQKEKLAAQSTFTRLMKLVRDDVRVSSERTSDFNDYERLFFAIEGFTFFSAIIEAGILRDKPKNKKLEEPQEHKE